MKKFACLCVGLGVVALALGGCESGPKGPSTDDLVMQALNRPVGPQYPANPNGAQPGGGQPGAGGGQSGKPGQHSHSGGGGGMMDGFEGTTTVHWEGDITKNGCTYDITNVNGRIVADGKGPFRGPGTYVCDSKGQVCCPSCGNYHPGQPTRNLPPNAEGHCANCPNHPAPPKP